MPDIAFVLFAAAVLCVFCVMLWGIQMSVSGNHMLDSDHAYLNLVGWSTLALFGIYYRVTPCSNSSGLARVHAGVAILGVIVMVPGIAIVVQGGTPAFAAAGTVRTPTSMAIFFFTALRHGFGIRA